MHVQRLQESLAKFGFQCKVIDFSPFKNIENVFNFKSPRTWASLISGNDCVVHIHSSGIDLPKIFFFFVLFLFCKYKRKTVVVTFHSFRNYGKYLKPVIITLLRRLFGLISHCITVNPDIKNQLLSFRINPEKISVIPAFLPPTVKQDEISKVPEDVWTFIGNHHPIISANAFQLTYFNSQDLYGLDMCVELCYILKRTNPNIGLIFCLSKVGDVEYLTKITKKIAEKSISDNFLLIAKGFPFYPILMNSDLFVRPTNTDGDALSVREALNFNVPVIASDIVMRPQHVVLFKNREIDDFASKVQNVLHNTKSFKKNLGQFEEDNFKKILQVYEKNRRL